MPIPTQPVLHTEDAVVQNTKPTKKSPTGSSFLSLATFERGRMRRFSTHTHLMALFPGLPRWASTRKVKPIWILLKQETVSGSGISWAISKSAPRSRQITTPAPHHSFYRPGALPAAQLTMSKVLQCITNGFSLLINVLLLSIIKCLYVWQWKVIDVARLSVSVKMHQTRVGFVFTYWWLIFLDYFLVDG